MRRPEAWAWTGLAAFASLYLLACLGVTTLHVGYPFALEWMEGGSVDHVRRILAGRPIYIEPTLEFAPFIYTPLYFYLGAAVASVAGVDFAAPAHVSTFPGAVSRT